ncbi:MAG: acyltransferase [Candidatus Poribacteria bacterium]
MQRRLYEIDLFRFIAAFGVVLYHYTFRGYAAEDMSPLSFPALSQIFKYGYLGVDLFFMISGFVILMTAFNKNLVGFIISRIVRLYPAFWVGVTLTTVVTLCIGAPKFSVNAGQYITNMTMLSGYFNIKHIDDVYWSLLVELRFYFLIFIIIAANKLKYIDYILGAWLAITIITLTFGIPRIVQALLFPTWSPYFIAGAMFYLIRKEGISAYKIMVIAISYLLSIKCALFRVQFVEKYFRTDFSEFAIACTIFVFFITFLLMSIGKTAWLSNKKLLTIGALTYPLYLIHGNIGFMIFNRYQDAANKYFILTSTIVCVLILSYTVNKYIETTVSGVMNNYLHIFAKFISWKKFKYQYQKLK